MANVGLSQSLSQNQTLAPQMRQSLEILQANTLELGQLINQALEVNPVLEDIIDHESLDEITDQEAPDTDDFDDWQDSYDDDVRDLAIMERRNKGTDHDAAERREHFYNSIVAPLSLQEHLAEQIRGSGVDEQRQTDAIVVVGNLTDHGFLDSPLEELSLGVGIPLKSLEKGLTLIQTLDPPGVGAADLRECLLMQLWRLGLAGSLEAKIVD
ncbi:RNA polymerase sigma-54 factor, partial [Akkermansiaceae bacterium]|nr:RNA polymerase sigma-54 factor [Akkermansiaceae bacterium]